MRIGKRHRRIPELNTTSTADISFMLLTFFLVTSSMDSDKGLVRQLPPPPQQQENEEMEVKIERENVMNVALDAGDNLSCDGKDVTPAQLKAKVMAFVQSKPTTHVISVKADPSTTYDAYFKMQNAIVAAYNRLRDKQARLSYGHSYAECNDDERAAVAKQLPQRISEAEPDEEGGAR